MLSVIRDDVTVMLDFHYTLLKLFDEEYEDTFFMDGAYFVHYGNDQKMKALTN